MNERKLVEKTLRERFLMVAPRELPNVRIFYREIIDTTVERHGRTYQLKSGTAGMADLFGYARGSPAIPVELELKAWNGVQSKEQIAWMNFCRTMGIPYLLLKQQKAETTEETIRRWVLLVTALLQTAIRPAMAIETSTRPSTPSSTDSPALAPPTAATSETPSALSAGSGPTFATSESGASGSRGTERAGLRTPRARSLRPSGRPA